ncbi:MAG: hypothetical protein WCA84_10615 [Ignavibacteriaceae bacterium]
MEDYEIIKKLKSGDDVTFRLVIEKYQKMVLNCSYKFLRNKESAEDITQEVFFESLLNEVQFKRRRIIYSESFQTYEFTVLGESSTILGIFIQESRMRENLSFGLTKVRGKQDIIVTEPCPTLPEIKK